MAGIKLKRFAGETPRGHPTVIPENSAQTAQNCHFRNGALNPLKNPTTIQAKTIPGTPLSVFRYTPSVWFEWDTDVDAHRSPIPNDAYDRVFFTGDGVPKVTDNVSATSTGAPYPSVAYNLGIPQPDSFTAAIVGTPTDPDSTAETRYYVVTYVDAYGAEGPPSDPSTEVVWRDGQTVDLSVMPAAPAGNYNMASKRLYRINTGTTGSVYQFVDSLTLAQTTYNDSIASADLSEALQTENYDPPASNMTGLTPLPGGFFAGHFNNVIGFSEPYSPHAWPVEYQQSTELEIVGIGAYGNSILVTTKGHPYVVVGSSPEAMSMVKVEMSQACVSKRGIVDVGSGIVYPSPDGLIYVGSDGAQVVTSGLFSKQDWQDLIVPTSIHAYLWESLYVGFYDNGVTQGGFIIDPFNPQDGVTFVDAYATAGYSDLETDTLYLVIGDNIVSWDTGTDDSYVWKSKLFRLSHATNYGAGQVFADSYPVTLDIYGDGVLRKKKSVVDDKPFRLPGGYLARDYEVQLSGNVTVTELLVVENMDDLGDN